MDCCRRRSRRQQACLSGSRRCRRRRPGRLMTKFHNLWTIEAPKGYALYFTHPANRFDLPITTLSGLVDCDRYVDNWIHFPAHWHDKNFVRRTSRLWRSASSGRCARMAWTAASRRSASAGQFGLRHGVSIIPGAASKRALCGDASVQPPDTPKDVTKWLERAGDCPIATYIAVWETLMTRFLTYALGAIALIAMSDLAAMSRAEARGGGSNFMNSPGYQRRLQESRGYVTNQSGSIVSRPYLALPDPYGERRQRRPRRRH